MAVRGSHLSRAVRTHAAKTPRQQRFGHGGDAWCAAGFDRASRGTKRKRTASKAPHVSPPEKRGVARRDRQQRLHMQGPQKQACHCRAAQARGVGPRTQAALQVSYARLCTPRWSRNGQVLDPSTCVAVVGHMARVSLSSASCSPVAVRL
jgi:hypothetical protein